GAVRAVGVFDRTFFFGFDDLEFCQRLQHNGFGIYVHGPSAIAARRRFGRLGDAVGPPPRRGTDWRRYYSVRNPIVILRPYSTTGRAVVVTAASLAGRPLRDVARRQASWGAFAASARGCRDAWTNRLGRTVTPPASAPG